MKHPRFPAPFALALCACLFGTVLYGQVADVPASELPDTELRLGLSAGLTKNYHLGSAIRFIDDPSCPAFESADPLWGVSGGLTGRYLFGERAGLMTHLLYSTRPGHGVAELPNAQALLPGPNGDPEIVSQTVRAITEIRYNLFEADLMWTYDVLQTKGMGLGIAVGGSLAHVDLLTLSARQELVEPEDARFINPAGRQISEDGRVVVIADDDPVPNASSTRASARGGAYLDLGFFKPFHITPGVYYDYGLTRVVKDMDWRLNSILFQLDVTVAL